MRYGHLLKILKKSGFDKIETEDHLLFQAGKNKTIMLPLVDGRKRVSDMHLRSVRGQLKLMGKKHYKDIKLPE